jgi:tetratricopeptide (TPR) repeat protein
VLLRAQRDHFGEIHQSVGLTLHNIGILFLKAEQYHDSLDAFEKAVRVRKGSIGRENEHVAESLVKVGIVLLLLKRFDDALYSFREALSIRRHALGHLHPSTARIYNNIGCVHVEFNELREARRAFEYALDIQRSALCYEPDNGHLLFAAATTLCNLGYLYTVRGMHHRASVVLLEALGLQEKVLGEEHATVIATLDNLAHSLGKSGDIGQALRCYKELICRLGLEADVQESKDMSAKDRRTLAVILFKMSGLHRKQNDYEAAITKLLEASAYESSIASPKFSACVKTQYETLRNSLEKQQLDWI